MKIGWSHDLELLDATASGLPQIEQVNASNAPWVLIRWDRRGQDQTAVYVLSLDEFLRRLRHTALPRRAGARAPALSKLLRLQELAPSTLVEPEALLEELPRLNTPSADPGIGGVLSGWRYAALPVSAEGAAVGGPDIGLKIAMRGAPHITRSAPPPEQTSAPGNAVDEGTTPLRYPSIEPEGTIRTGEQIALVVDLLRDKTATALDAIVFPELPDGWTTVPVEVTLTSPDIEFDADGRATLEVRRNAASRSARLTGRVLPGLAPGDAIQVRTRFFLGQRFCGSATRMLALGGAAPPPPPAGTPDAAVQIDTTAAQPDMTVEISIADPDKPTRLTWSMSARPFKGRPAKLNGVVNLGQKPEAEASGLFSRFAKLERGEHRAAIEGFGEELWTKSPPEFQAVYWALCDHFKRPLTIQFISDDPYMPWELMNPHRHGEQHGPIALRHAVARWLLLYKGYMDNRLPKGSLLAMAPHYDAGRDLPLAEAAAQALVNRLGAQRLEGKRATFLQLLESPPPEPVAMFYFTGHGAFSTDAAGASRLKLEDGSEITPMEVKRQKVTLGERDGTVVFLNACEVGATGGVLGNVGGWADAFLSRSFRAFIAPLWAIDEEDAAQATAELMDAIVKKQQPLGEALRDLRAKHGAVSPTFYSYLLFGDVTARLGTA